MSLPDSTTMPDSPTCDYCLRNQHASKIRRDCGHEFHRVCHLKWTRESCPVCRFGRVHRQCGACHLPVQEPSLLQCGCPFHVDCLKIQMMRDVSHCRTCKYPIDCWARVEEATPTYYHSSARDLREFNNFLKTRLRNPTPNCMEMYRVCLGGQREKMIRMTCGHKMHPACKEYFKLDRGKDCIKCDFDVEDWCDYCSSDILEDDRTIRLDPCNHTVHQVCLLKWLELGDNETCPVCKFCQCPEKYADDCECVDGLNLKQCASCGLGIYLPFDTMVTMVCECHFHLACLEREESFDMDYCRNCLKPDGFNRLSRIIDEAWDGDIDHHA